MPNLKYLPNSYHLDDIGTNYLPLLEYQLLYIPYYITSVRNIDFKLIITTNLDLQDSDKFSNSLQKRSAASSSGFGCIDVNING
jgi:hypothetical protein